MRGLNAKQYNSFCSFIAAWLPLQILFALALFAPVQLADPGLRSGLIPQRLDPLAPFRHPPPWRVDFAVQSPRGVCGGRQPTPSPAWAGAGVLPRRRLMAGGRGADGERMGSDATGAFEPCACRLPPSSKVQGAGVASESPHPPPPPFPPCLTCSPPSASGLWRYPTASGWRPSPVVERRRAICPAP